MDYGNVFQKAFPFSLLIGKSNSSSLLTFLGKGVELKLALKSNAQ